MYVKSLLFYLRLKNMRIKLPRLNIKIINCQIIRYNLRKSYWNPKVKILLTNVVLELSNVFRKFNGFLFSVYVYILHFAFFLFLVDCYAPLSAFLCAPAKLCISAKLERHKLSSSEVISDSLSPSHSITLSTPILHYCLHLSFSIPCHQQQAKVSA